MKYDTKKITQTDRTLEISFDEIAALICKHTTVPVPQNATVSVVYEPSSDTYGDCCDGPPKMAVFRWTTKTEGQP